MSIEQCLLQALHAIHSDESGQDLIEYALIVALISLASIVGMKALANSINNAFSVIGSKLSNAIGR